MFATHVRNGVACMRKRLTEQRTARAPLGNSHLFLWQHLVQCVVETWVLLLDTAHDAAHDGGLHLALCADVLVEGEAVARTHRGTRVRKWNVGMTRRLPSPAYFLNSPELMARDSLELAEDETKNQTQHPGISD